MNYKFMRKYFFPGFPIGILLIVIGGITLTVDSMYGALIIVIGIVLAFLRKVPTDKQVDEMIGSHISNMTIVGMQKLGLDEAEIVDVQPVCIHGHIFSSDVLIKQGRDKRYRSSVYKVIIMYFTEHDVQCYSDTFSIIEPHSEEATDVYFYKDIVSVSTNTTSTSLVVDKKEYRLSYEVFKLTTAGGTSIECAIRNSDELQRTINGMRNLIKSKKMQ